MPEGLLEESENLSRSSASRPDKAPECILRALLVQVGADKAYDTKEFVTTVRELNVTPHMTKNDKDHSSNLDRRTTRQPGYNVSLSRRWLVEKGFGWFKQTGPLRQVKLRGLEKVDWLFVFSCAAHNLIRLPRLESSSNLSRCSSGQSIC